MSAEEVRFHLHGEFSCPLTTRGKATGEHCLQHRDGYVTDALSGKRYDELLFVPEHDTCSVEIQKVTIGIDFHWERTETQTFAGSLHVIVDGGKLLVINIIDAEEYLQSVISSEMRATASPEFLKTHAVISRSWLMAQMEKQRAQSAKKTCESCIRTDTEWIQWSDREDHTLFDVCADDHCQRYQGTTRIVSPAVKEAVEATCGIILSYGGKICDARFSKCCGGVTETFENTWEPVVHPYLTRVSDGHAPLNTDLTDETQAREWILASPPAFCHTSDKTILEQTLNRYDMETSHFFRWKASYGQNELSELVAARSGIDFGRIIDLVPVERGVSGRIIRLRIEGERRSMVIGKELLIRRCLSSSHLYSSAFVVDRETGTGGTSFTLHGAGWGHGVGLCQIGAAVMCGQGFTYRQVLSRYYPGSIPEKRY
jgi:SpoIID/LytB domain protein